MVRQPLTHFRNTLWHQYIISAISYIFESNFDMAGRIPVICSQYMFRVEPPKVYGLFAMLCVAAAFGLSYGSVSHTTDRLLVHLLCTCCSVLWHPQQEQLAVTVEEGKITKWSVGNEAVQVGKLMPTTSFCHEITAISWTGNLCMNVPSWISRNSAVFLTLRKLKIEPTTARADRAALFQVIRKCHVV